MNRCLHCGKELILTNEVTYCTDCQNKIRNTANNPSSYDFPKVVGVIYKDDHIHPRKILYVTLDNGITYIPMDEDNA